MIIIHEYHRPIYFHNMLKFQATTMFNTSIIVFITVWALWFLIDKHPSSLGVVLPDESDTLLENFQLAFDLLSAGFLSGSFVFIWKAHYIVLTVIFALVISVVYDSISKAYRRRNLRNIMSPHKLKDTKNNEEKET